ncbi:MAG: sigma-70 family RNA polymerase sigma factor [Anaerolineales bacterium]
MDEITLITRARQGDQEAFLALLDLHQRAVYNLCYRMLGQAEDAEDAAQETFLRAYQHLSRYDPRRPFLTWLLSIAAHHCIDRLRRQRPGLSLDETDEDQTLPMVADPSQPDPQLHAERHEQNILVQRLLLQLSPLDRAVIILRYWYEFSEAEIGQHLGLTVSAVKSRLHRARRQLAVLWSQQESASLPRSAYESPAF